MASINSLMGSSSSTSSIFGNSNTITGLASGMDTESMIENAVSGIKKKIDSFKQDRTMLEWEQESYRSIIDKLADFADKYTSYSSSTNLLSTAFFDQATAVNTTGTYKNMVSAIGVTESDIKVLGATMAKAATYSSVSEKFKDQTIDLSKSLKELGVDLGDGTLQIGIAKKAEDGTTTTEMVTIEGITEDSTIAEILGKINSSEAGIKVSYSETSQEFYLKSKGTGAGEISFAGGIAEALFGAHDAVKAEEGKGNDAELRLNVNGKDLTNPITDSSNQITVDGMTISIKGDFAAANDAEAVSFTTSVDTDKVVNAVKAMVEEYNTMANEIKDAYNTKPLTTSKGARYEPLTEDQAKEMSESAIEKYEKDAKTGILFADGDLSALYNEMRSAINALGFTDIGLTTEYSGGKTTLKLDEAKLRSTLEADPDKVKEAFTKSKADGADENGGMQMLKDTLDKYAKTTGDKGILVNLVGSSKSPLSLTNNFYKTQMDETDEKIQRWEDKLLDKIDYYNRQFTRLEKLISDMNAQSSALMGFMGY